MYERLSRDWEQRKILYFQSIRNRGTIDPSVDRLHKARSDIQIPIGLFICIILRNAIYLNNMFRNYENLDPPVAREYLETLLRAGESLGARGWKSDLSRQYAEIVEAVEGEPQNIRSVTNHLNRVLVANSNCTLQLFLWVAWILGFEVRLVPRKENKRKTSIDEVT